MLIRDLEEKTGLNRATIRFYEKEGLIDPQRKENGYRQYSQEHLSHLIKIKLLRQLGMSLNTIKALQQGREDFDVALSNHIQMCRTSDPLNMRILGQKCGIWNRFNQNV